MGLLLLGAGSPGSAGPPQPRITSATILANGTTLRIVFRKAVNGSTGFTLTGASGGVTGLTYSSGTGTTTLDYTIDRTVYSNETGAKLNYTPGNITTVSAATAMDAFTNRPVTNSSTQTAPSTGAGVRSLFGFWFGGGGA